MPQKLIFESTEFGGDIIEKSIDDSNNAQLKIKVL